MQPYNMMNKRQARYLRDLQPFVGSMTLAYRKGALCEANTLSRRPYFVIEIEIEIVYNMCRQTGPTVVSRATLLRHT
jgi:hypothetical protein